MNNNLDDIEKLARKGAFEGLLKWYAKIDFIKDQVKKLDSLKEFPIFALASFHLKTQLVEFELKQLLSSIEFNLHQNNTSKVAKRKTRTPRYFDDKKFTLGRLVEEMSFFNGNEIDELNNNLIILVEERNKFTHNLFNQKTQVEDLVEVSKKSLPLANIVLKQIENINKKFKNKY